MKPIRTEDYSENKQEFGPGWQDVRELWDWVEKEHKAQICLEVQLTKSINLKKGFRCLIKAKTTGAILAAAGFGPAYAASARTMPGALLMALYEVQHAIEDRVVKGLPWDHAHLFNDAPERTPEF